MIIEAVIEMFSAVGYSRNQQLVANPSGWLLLLKMQTAPTARRE